jgi:hypothetical protein
MRIGVTGHQRLSEAANWLWVREELDRLLLPMQAPLIGITSLAIGADQLFATAVLLHGGLLEIIIPFSGYESTFSEACDRQEYDRLLQCAARVDILVTDGTKEEAYFAAGKNIVNRSELLIAVWDGKPAVGLGGTGDIVNYAMRQHMRTIHINPTTHNVAEYKPGTE